MLLVAWAFLIDEASLQNLSRLQLIIWFSTLNPYAEANGRRGYHSGPLRPLRMHAWPLLKYAQAPGERYDWRAGRGFGIFRALFVYYDPRHKPKDPPSEFWTIPKRLIFNSLFVRLSPND